jgi:prepilin-type N-terminal cleavage/methylation domain-containing protein
LGKRHRGFTLVEVIVVLVILAILAAIAIPALTGYIDKAEDKKWIAQARDAMVALRAVIDDAYADGTFGANLPASGDDSDYLSNGTTRAKLKDFNIGIVSQYDSSNTKGSKLLVAGSNTLYYRRASELMGAAYPNIPADITSGQWYLGIFSPPSSDYNIFNAPAWSYTYWPDGESNGMPEIVVTYGLSGIPDNITTQHEFGDAIKYNVICDPDAGYKVYHLTFNGW